MSETAFRPPYPGLRSFRRSETELFFGRDGCINAMVDRLAATRFLAVLGSSGTGKSSIVKAGLLDGLELGLMAKAGSNWSVVDFRPENAPLRNLARLLLSVAEPDVEHSEADIELQRTIIARGPRSVIDWCRAGHLPEGANLLLLVDQFEELFRYQDYAGREEAEAFVELLIESARNKEFPIYVAITMRSEYLGACALIEGLAEQINAGMYLTPRMTREECRQAIVGPARVCDIEIKGDLVNRLLNDLASFAPWDEGSTPERENTQLNRLVRRADQLPLLQYTLNRMWLVARDRAPDKPVVLGLADYKGLTHALNEHADAIFEGLNKQKLPVEKVFRALTTGSTIANAVRQPTRFDMLVRICDGDEAGVRKIVDAYRAPDCNFLFPEIDKPLGPSTVIDIGHESLIRQWKRLSEWLSKESFAAQNWHRLNELYEVGDLLRGRVLANLVAWRRETNPNAAWATRYGGGDYASVIAFLDRSERAARRRRIVQVGSVAAVFAVLLGAAIVTFYQWQLATRNLARAESNYSIAKDVFRGLTFDIATLVGNRQSQMLVMEITDAHKNSQQKLEKLIEANPDDVELVGIQAVMVDKFAAAYAETSYSDEALARSREANGLFRRLVALVPGDDTWTRYLAFNLDRIGDLQGDAGVAQPSGRASYEEALAIFRELARREPENEEYIRQIAIELVKIGDQQVTRDAPGAGKSYEEALSIYRVLAGRYSLLGIYSRDVSKILRKLADMRLEANDLAAALQLYDEALKFDFAAGQHFFDSSRVDEENVALDLGKIAEIQLKLNKPDEALNRYDQQVKLNRSMSDDETNDSKRLTLKKTIRSSLFQIADIQLEKGDIPGAKKSYQEAFDADTDAAFIASFVNWKGATDKTRTDLLDANTRSAWSGVLAGEAQQAATYAERVLRVHPERAATDINRGHAYLMLGRYNDAKAIYVARKDVKLSADGPRTFVDEIREDFDILRKLGYATPDFDRMAQELGL